MRRRVWLSVPLLLFANAMLAMAQSKMPAGPSSPPLILQRFREVVKVGRNDAHEALEHTWAGAWAKSKLPVYSVAMTSMTGPNDAWWLSGYASFKDLDDMNASIAKNKELSTSISQYSAKDVENISDGISTIWALRADLSYRDTVDWSRMHAYEILTVRVRPGHNDDLKKITDKLAATHKAARTSAHWATYQGLMGVPDGTYMVLVPHTSVADLDVGMREDAQFGKALGEVGGKELDKLSADGIISVETNLFAVNAKMSYVSDAWRAADVDFWKGSAVLQAGAAVEKPAAKKP